MERQFNTMEFYRNKVSKMFFGIAIGAIIAAIGCCVLCLLMNLFATTPRYMFGIFMVIGILEILAFIRVYKKVFKKQTIGLKEYNILKYAAVTICVINYTLIINLMPSQMLWASVGFFMMFICLFQDFKLVKRVSVIYGMIILVFFITHPIESLQQNPAKDELVVRVVLFFLSLSAPIISTYFSGHVLAGVGQDLMDENTKKLTDVIKNVSLLMEKLKLITNKLVGISQEENASMEEITSVSLSIVSDNNEMITKSEHSQKNLNTLEVGVKNISDQMKLTRSISDTLLEMSKANEEALGDILEICGTIDESTNHTLDVTQALENKVEQIDGLLSLIENIAGETNLLALNASIEAARAGEEGRGFSVVAEQVKRLSENTSQSLKDVNQVIQDFKADTKQVEALMVDNVKQVQRQNNVTHDTVETIREMLLKLRDSAQKIDEVNSLAQSQDLYTKEAVLFNEEVVQSMKEQVARVESISKLVDENRQAIEQIVVEVDGLNEVVEEINKVLQ